MARVFLAPEGGRHKQQRAGREEESKCSWMLPVWLLGRVPLSQDSPRKEAQ